MSIQVKNLHKSFGDKQVLKGINIEFFPGKVNMIIGASGSGKTVMLKNIVGLMSPTDGEILYDNLDFHNSNHKQQRKIRLEIGMLFQFSALFDSMTVEENIAFPMKMFTKNTKNEIKSRVQELLEEVNMPGIEKLYPSEISGGMKKRVGIARAIALNPKYLFCDEPNSGLDPLTAKVIDELIQNITYEHDMTTVVVSHDMNSVLNIGDKIMYLYHGKKEWQGTNQEMLNSGNDKVNEFVFVSDWLKPENLKENEG